MYRKRRSKILELMELKPAIMVNELSDLFKISAATVRRDLEQMEQEGLLRRINGGAVRKEALVELPINEENVDSYWVYKAAIAKRAVQFIQPGDTIFMDSGSTNNIIADLLALYDHISVVTNSIEIAYKLSRKKKITVSVCGGTMGEINPEDSIVGPLAEKMISEYRANVFFMGTSGIDLKHGITDPYISAARIKAAMIANSSRTILVCDHSKFGKINKAFISPLHNIHQVITDTKAPVEDVEQLRELGIEVILA
jgi:DeoR/GlpR family transcriptional regulator of sugar metabolism